MKIIIKLIIILYSGVGFSSGGIYFQPQMQVQPICWLDNFGNQVCQQPQQYNGIQQLIIPGIQFGWGNRPHNRDGWNNYQWRENHGYGHHQDRDRD